MWQALIFLFLSALPAAAQAIEVADYADLDGQLNMRADFETLPRRAEPGFDPDALYRHRGLWLGERLDGQVIDRLEPALDTGINEIAARRDGYRSDISALTIVNSDPGGIRHRRYHLRLPRTPGLGSLHQSVAC
jgi:hypothetical protein